MKTPRRQRPTSRAVVEKNLKVGGRDSRVMKGKKEKSRCPADHGGGDPMSTEGKTALCTLKGGGTYLRIDS